MPGEYLTAVTQYDFSVRMCIKIMTNWVCDREYYFAPFSISEKWSHNWFSNKLIYFVYIMVDFSA